VTRRNGDGTIDASYGDGGRTVVTGAEGITVLDDGAVIVAGFGGADYRVLRLQGEQAPQGSQLDVTLNSKGTLVLHTAGSGNHDVRLYIRGRDGRLVVRDGMLSKSFAPSKVKRIAV